MSDSATRFTRLRAHAAGGAKLCGRRDVNPALSLEQAFDEASFHLLLEQHFGASDPPGDAEFIYCIRDEWTGLEFMVYSANSGPSYGGDPGLYETLADGGLTLGAKARRVLSEFEVWRAQSSRT